MYGTTTTGRPDPNSAPSTISSSGATLSGSACAITERSKRRAIAPNVSAAPARLAPTMRDSNDTPARFAAVSNLAIASVAAFSLSARCASISDAGMPAHDGRRNHRLVAERDPPTCASKVFGDRDRIGAGDIARLADGHVDDEILDHGCSGLLRRTAARLTRRPEPCLDADQAHFLLPVAVELLEISPQIGALVFALDAGEHHLGAGNLGARIGDVFLETCFVPGDAGILVGFGVVVALDGAGLAAVEAVERPGRPCSWRPRPTRWQGRHFLNEFSPAATSCASALADPPRNTTGNDHFSA